MWIASELVCQRVVVRGKQQAAVHPGAQVLQHSMCDGIPARSAGVMLHPALHRGLP